MPAEPNLSLLKLNPKAMFGIPPDHDLTGSDVAIPVTRSLSLGDAGCQAGGFGVRRPILNGPAVRTFAIWALVVSAGRNEAKSVFWML